jgi:SAM-dependent methyltransferase
MASMESTLKNLEFPGLSTWSEYESDNTYDEAHAKGRDRMIMKFVVGGQSHGCALDIGANAGRHSAILAEKFQTVIAIDSDRVVLEALRGRFSESHSGGTVFPVVADIADPTPPRGFLNSERAGLIERLAGADLAIWMAVMHHLAIGRSVPLRGIATLAAELAPRHLIEFVEPGDPMVQLLAASKGSEHHAYDVESFESAFKETFDLEPLGKTMATRSLYGATIR